MAALITDTVTLNGREWAQPDLFGGLSWQDIRGACRPGSECKDRELNGWNMDGWVWASYAEVAPIFNTYIDRDGGGNNRLGSISDSYSFKSPLGYYPSQIAYDFFSETGFRPTNTYLAYVCGRGFCVQASIPSLQLAGWTSDSEVRGIFNRKRYGGAARLIARGDLESVLGVPSVAGSLWWDSESVEGGGWFYRAATTVPAPSALLLVAFALLILGRGGKWSASLAIPAAGGAPARLRRHLTVQLR